MRVTEAMHERTTRMNVNRKRRAVSAASTLLSACTAILAAGCLPASDASSAPEETTKAQDTRRVDGQTMEESQGLPAGWRRIRGSRLMTWRPEKPIPVTDAFIEVHADERIVLVPTIAKDRKSLSVLVPERVRDLSSLRVVAAGARIDRAETPKSTARVSEPVFAEATAARLANLPASADPGVPGPYQTAESEYDEPAVKIPGLNHPVEMRAVVVAPVGATGPLPVAVFYHGNHATCYTPQADQPAAVWPCPQGALPIDSHRGYLEAQRLLASQGVITFSVSANGISGQVGEEPTFDAGPRSALLRAHLSKWSKGAAGFSSDAASTIGALEPDLNRLLLIGHSRGGDAVNRFALDSATTPGLPWRVQGQLLIGPVLAQRNPTPGLPAVVLLPACDGDVLDLQGQQFADAARDVTTDNALRSVVLLEGANHNFFNTVWTPGIGPDGSNARDDADSDVNEGSICDPRSPSRLTPAEQSRLGAVYIAAAAQTFLFEREDVARLIDGTPVRAESAGEVAARSHALGGHRTALLVPAPNTPIEATAGLDVQRCLTSRRTSETEVACEDGVQGATPSFGAYLDTDDEPSRTALHLRWASSGGQAQIGLTGGVLDSQATDVTARVIVSWDTVGGAFAVNLVDKKGVRFALGRASVDGVARDEIKASGVHWAQEVRFLLDRTAAADAGIDLTQLSGLEIAPESATGEIWLLDVWGHRAGLPRAQAASVARIDLQGLSIVETEQPQQVYIKGSIEGSLNEPALVYYAVQSDLVALPQTDTLTLSPGMRTFQIPVNLPGDEVDMGNVDYKVRVIGVTGAVAGEGSVPLQLKDNEITPTVEYEAQADVLEGEPLVWTFRLPSPSSRDLIIYAKSVPPTDGLPELSSRDIDSEPTEAPELPLSEVPADQTVVIAAGQLTATLELPTVPDGVVEGLEAVSFAIQTYPGSPAIPGIEDGALLVGTVTDAD